MCGISGIIKKNKEVATKHDLKPITDLISHRGPDDEGYYTYENLGFGHRRLSILDLSSEGHQPMAYLDKYIISYNGEIYNYLEIREGLQKLGYTFKSKTDTEVILAAYDYWGEECCNQFNGMWAFAIHDKKRQTVFCSRDRFGVKPFYYFENAQTFAFGSEIKVFTALKEWEPTLNLTRAIDFLVFSIFDHTTETLFSNVFQLRGGHNLIYDLQNSKYSIRKWYNFSEKLKANLPDFETARKELYSVFEDAVRLRLRSDVKVGSCLSGGIDSSAIVCVMNQLLAKEGKNDVQEVVSSCFIEKQFDEQEYIDEVVASTGVKPNKVFPRFDELFAQLQHIIWHQDEPFGSTSIFAQWNVFKEAKNKGLTVMLDGQGADESLAGYPYFRDVYNVSLLRTANFKKLNFELKPSDVVQKNKNGEFIKLAFKSVMPSSLTKILRRQSNSHALKYIKNPFKKLVGIHEPKIPTGIKTHSLDLIESSHLPMLLHYEDRDSMAHSVESRVPFLDYRLVELILNLPDEYKINNGITKFIFRESMNGIIPDKIKNRYDKMGFVTPEQLWIKNNAELFKGYLKEAADHFSFVLDADKLLTDYDNATQSSSISFGSIFWRVVTLHQWAKTFKVNCSTKAV